MRTTVQVAVNDETEWTADDGRMPDGGKIAAVSTYVSAGLAVTRIDGAWAITHRDSGLRVCGAESQQHARLVLDALNPILDWERPGHDIARIGKRKTVKAKLDAAINTPAPAKKPRPTFIAALLANPLWRGATVEQLTHTGNLRSFRVARGSAEARIIGEESDVALVTGATPTAQPAPIGTATGPMPAPPATIVPASDLAARRHNAAVKAWATRRAKAA